MFKGHEHFKVTHFLGMLILSKLKACIQTASIQTQLQLVKNTTDWLLVVTHRQVQELIHRSEYADYGSSLLSVQLILFPVMSLTENCKSFIRVRIRLSETITDGWWETSYLLILALMLCLNRRHILVPPLKFIGTLSSGLCQLKPMTYSSNVRYSYAWIILNNSFKH